jgi:beta-1,4-mannosyl-glycoprotein beta-1,4-N-acetylglucosaminyltransferase
MIEYIVHLCNELDILDLNLHELYDTVDKFFIVEHPFSCSRRPQKMHYNENKARFKKFEDKIVHIIDGNEYGGKGGLGLFFTRVDSPLVLEALKKNCDPEKAYIISADGDIAIKKEALTPERFDQNKVSTLHLRWCMWWFNYVTTNTAFPYTLCTPFKYILQAGSIGRVGNWIEANRPEGQTIPDAGWHFTKCGGAEAASECISGHPHQEFNTPEFTDVAKIQERIDNNWGWNDSTKGQTPLAWNWVYEDYDPKNYPEYLNNHPEIYDRYFKGGMKK